MGNTLTSSANSASSRSGNFPCIFSIAFTFRDSPGSVSSSSSAKQSAAPPDPRKSRQGMEECTASATRCVAEEVVGIRQECLKNLLRYPLSRILLHSSPWFLVHMALTQSSFFTKLPLIFVHINKRTHIHGAPFTVAFSRLFSLFCYGFNFLFSQVQSSL